MSWDSDLSTDSAAFKFAADSSKVIRVVAGPGTGKSFGLQRRVARLLNERCDPEKILTVTFTRTAAKDLKNDIHGMGIPGSEKVVAITLHGLCLGLLGKTTTIRKTGKYPRPVLEFETKPMLYDLSSKYGNLREKKKLLHAFEAAWARLQSEEPGFPKDDTDRQFELDLSRWLKNHRAMLFGEMIIETLRYLVKNPDCEEITQFDHILVDEYQDLNKAEQAVIELLSRNCSLAIIGDDDQSIYSFKHAHPEGIREFSSKHPGCAEVVFEQCRRCPKRVVRIASRLISNNMNRTLGDLQVYDQNQEGSIFLKQWKTIDEEIRGIGIIIDKVIKSGEIRPEDVLILVPYRKIGYKMRNQLVGLGISAKSYFRESALSSEILKFNYELFKLIANPNDFVSLRYLLGYGNSNFRSKSYIILSNYANQNKQTVFEVLQKCVNGEIKIAYTDKIVTRYSEIQAKIQGILSAINDDRESLIDCLSEDVPENQDFRQVFYDAFEEIGVETGDNLGVWIRKIHKYLVERISFLENVSERDHIRIMSLHASKGLSAKYVVIMSAIDELIPRLNKEGTISLERQLEEQRRLFYVAITRCKSSENGYGGTLLISSFSRLSRSDALEMNISVDSKPWMNVIPSRFIQELRKKKV